MEEVESLFVLVSKDNQKKIFLRQCADGTYYFSRKKREDPKKWVLQKVYLEAEDVTLTFSASDFAGKKIVTAISNPNLERIFLMIEPSKFAPFEHKARTYDTAKIMEEMALKRRLRSQKISIVLIIAVIVILMFLLIRLFIY